MGANLITWSGQTVTPQYDALVFGLFALDGIIYGVDITQSASDPNIINISNGYGIIQGRFFTIEEFSVNVELTTGATYQGQLILHMDLSNADEPISVVVDTGATIRSLIKDDDVNIVNGIYEMQLCTFAVDTAAVTDIAITYPEAITFNSIMDHIVFHSPFEGRQAAANSSNNSNANTASALTASKLTVAGKADLVDQLVTADEKSVEETETADQIEEEAEPEAEADIETEAEEPSADLQPVAEQEETV